MRLNSLPVFVFGLFGLVAFGMVDFAQRKLTADAAGVSYSAQTYLGELQARFAPEAIAAPQPESLATALPRPPEGWLHREMAFLDLELLSGRSLSDAEARTVPLLQLAEPVADDGLRRERRTYLLGPKQLVLELRQQPAPYAPAPDEAGFFADFEALGAGGTGFAVIRGVAFRELDRPEDRPYREITADLGAEISVYIATNISRDSAILALLERVDLGRLNKLNQTPVPGLGLLGDARLASADRLRFNEALDTETLRRRGFLEQFLELERAQQGQVKVHRPEEETQVSRLFGWLRERSSKAGILTCKSDRGFKHCAQN